MLVATSLATDTRVMREAEALVEDGYQVHIIGKEVPGDFTPRKGITWSSAFSGSGLRPAGTPSLSGKKLLPHLRFARWLLLPQHREKSFVNWAEAVHIIGSHLEFDAVHAHDFTALAVGERLAREHGVALVYDSHEWWFGRQRQHRQTPLLNARQAKEEADLASRAVAVITVGNAIADLFRSQRKIENVFVVRNSFPQSKKASEVTSPPRGLIYAGRIDAWRELETITEVAPRTPLSITWMGEADNQWAQRNVPLARAAGIEVLPSQSIEQVSAAMQKAGLALVTHSNEFVSHQLAMPNKLFHAVQAGVPVIATDVPELHNIVTEYDLGELYTPGDADSMLAAIHRAFARHTELVANVRAAQGALSWESDREILLGIYEAIFRKRR